MDTLNTEHIRTQLTERRGKLQQILARRDAEPSDESLRAELLTLLQDVDVALEKIARGTYGICETCHDSIEADRLAVDPLIRNCLDHLTRAEQRVLEHDLDLAYEVQKNLLPKQGLRIHGWETAYHYEPAGSVSGDYCDLIDVGDCLYFFIGDVTGKGVAASILMAHLHAIFRSLVHARHPFDRLMEEANRLFCEGTLSTHFATLVCGRANADGDVEVSNAGHVPPLVLRAASVEKVAPTGIPLGMFCSSKYTTQHLTLAKGESLVLYTDGVTETRNDEGTFYGEGRLMNLIERKKSLAASEIINSCLTDLSRHRGNAARTDDVAMMVVRRG